MATLQSLSTLKSESGRGNGAFGILLEASPFLRWLESQSAWQLDASTFTYETVEETSTAPSRAVGSNYTAADRTRAALLSGSLKNHGDAVSTDITLVADAAKGLRGADLWLESAMSSKVSSWGEKFEALLFNGSGSGNNLKGLIKILDGTTDLPGFTGFTGVANAATATTGSPVSLDISNSTNAKKFLEFLRLQKALVPNATGIIMNPSVWARLNTIAHELNMVTPGGLDMFGKQIPLFDGTPIVEVLPDTILLDEADDTPTTPLTNTTSVYIAAPGENVFSLRTNSGFYYIDHDHIANTNKGQEWFEIRSCWTISKKRSIRRIRNIKL